MEGSRKLLESGDNSLLIVLKALSGYYPYQNLSIYIEFIS
jgi:hypothetical protein